ncbi:hypothetical protein BDV28DRAFT_145690 [Aspergillus coremiiformis]|uniref:Uncharacterized protein n=1 Tax=Aspergillus coremiiformis TaxID=138285 RepID=A0A5N6ZE00_9EURO|nr:hypothetical protein BDV28DRAFT_145690 [Aspergillus coremiiformis]
MRRHIVLIMAASLAVASTIPDLFIGTIEGCGSNKYGPDWYVWSEDMYRCAGADLGPVNSYLEYGVCEKPITLPGYGNISFTGCTARIPPYGQSGPPTGVSENGVPMLVCTPATLPGAECPSPCNYGPPVIVTTNYTCIKRLKGSNR